MKFKRRLKIILKSYKTIIISLIVLVLILIGFCMYLMHVNRVYMFNGSSDYVDIYNGVISLNNDINLFEGSDVNYKLDKDIVVIKYKIGYYIKNKDVFKELYVIEDEDERGFSLRALLEGISVFNFTELSHNSKRFTNRNVELLNNGLYFIIEFINQKGEVIKDITTLDLTKLTK